MPTFSNQEIPLSRAQHGDPNAFATLQRRSDSPGAGFFDHYALGCASLASGDLASAGAAARKSLAAAPDHPSALVLMANVALHKGEPREAIPLMEKMVRQVPDQPLGWVMLAQAHAAAREPAQAWETLERGRERLPRSVAILEARHALALQSGDGRRVLQAAADLRRLDPKSAGAAYRFGKAALLAGLLGQARDGFAAAVALAPNAWRARHELGKVCVALDELDLAAAELERALELQPGQPDVSRDLAAVWVELYAPAKAEAVLRRALQANESDERLHLDMGLVLASQGRTREALRHAERAAASKDPEYAAQGEGLRARLVSGKAA